MSLHQQNRVKKKKKKKNPMQRCLNFHLVLLLSPRSDFISDCFSPVRSATHQWLDLMCLCVEFFKPMTAIKLLPQLSALLESAYFISTHIVLYTQSLGTTAEMIQDLLQDNNHNQPWVCFTVALSSVSELSLNSLVILKDSRSQSCGEKRERGKNQGEKQENIFGIKWERHWPKWL